MAKKGELNERQRRFVDEYIIDLNATQAAIRAGYSEKTAYSIGQKLLKKVEAQKAIQEKMKKREERTEVTADQVVKELSKIAFSDLKAVLEWDENGIRLKPMNDVDGAILQEISETETETEFQTKTTRKVKLYDKLKALELLGKHLGIFNDKLDLTGDLSLKVEIDYGEDE
jgi:phage terminase small subunit